ncbi:MAG: hypothetical protein ACI4QM_04015 [Alphaproteobacteria bacterium]
MTDPTTLLQTRTDCPADCPFLSACGFLPELLPFYCHKYEQFLGADTHHRTARCGACREIMETVVQVGLSLIEAYTQSPLSITQTKEAFLALDTTLQALFVEVVQKTGRQVAITAGQPATAEALTAAVLATYQQAKEWAGSPEVIDFKGTLEGVFGSSSDLFTRETKTLLMNLFQVLDHSERAMLKDILSTPRQAESFLQAFSHMPRDMNLLKNFRHQLYEYDAREKQNRQNQYVRDISRLYQNTQGRNTR